MKEVFLRKLTHLVSSTADYVSKIGVKETSGELAEPILKSSERRLEFETFDAASSFAKQLADNGRGDFSLNKHGQKWVVHIKAENEMEAQGVESKDGLREIAEQILAKVRSLAASFGTKRTDFEYDYDKYGCGTAYIHQRLLKLAEQNKNSSSSVDFHQDEFELSEHMVRLHYAEFLEMSEPDLDRRWEQRDTLNLNEFEGLRRAVREKKGLAKLAVVSPPAVCPTCFMVGSACTCERRD